MPLLEKCFLTTKFFFISVVFKMFCGDWIHSILVRGPILYVEDVKVKFNLKFFMCKKSYFGIVYTKMRYFCYSFYSPFWQKNRFISYSDERVVPKLLVQEFIHSIPIFAHENEYLSMSQTLSFIKSSFTDLIFCRSANVQVKLHLLQVLFLSRREIKLYHPRIGLFCIQFHLF